MPWQQHVADVAMEIDPATGLLWYRRITLLVPRQSGKSTLILAVFVHRALAWSHAQRSIYLAQTGLDARGKWHDDWLPMLEKSPFGKHRPKLFKPRKTNGQEALFWRNGSSGPSPGPLTPKSGHGKTTDLVVLDEAFAQVDGRVESNYSPTMITREDRQFWIVSTAGESEGKSPFLWGKVQTGRERVAEGRDSRNAYFEWSAPDEADRTDPRVWLDTMPAIGHTVTLDDIQSELDGMENDVSEFDRAYLNRWGTAVTSSVISSAAWDAGARSTGIAGAPILSVEVSNDRHWSTIVATGHHVGAVGEIATETVAVDRGTSWVIDRLGQLISDHHVTVVGVDATGPAASLIPQIKGLGVHVEAVGGTDMARAAATLYDAVRDGLLVHRNQAEINVAALNAQRRTTGETWRWSRSASNVDISPLLGVTVGHWLVSSGVAAEPVASEPAFMTL